MHTMANIELTLNPGYVHTWDVWCALRELLQNAADGVIDGFPMVVTYNPQAKLLRIANKGCRLTRDTLLLGVSSKRSGEYRGMFGEGYKLALLVLTRLGHDVTVRTHDEYWKPSLVKSDTFDGAEVLRISTRPATTEFDGVRFDVRGVEPLDYETAKQRCLFLQDDAAAQRNTSTMLTGENAVNTIYARGIYVSTSADNFRFGYDLHDDIRVDRDRKMADTGLVRLAVGRVLVNEFRAGNLSAAAVAELASTTPTTGEARALVEACCYDYEGRDLVAAVANAFVAQHGTEATPVLTDSEYAMAEQCGLRPVRVTKEYQTLLELELGRLNVRVERVSLSPSTVYQLDQLSSTERATYAWAMRLATVGGFDMATYSVNVVDFRGPNICGTFSYGGAPNDNAVHTVRLARKLLSDRAECIATLVHELAHRFGGDGTAQHRTCIETTFGRIAAGLIV